MHTEFLYSVDINKFGKNEKGKGKFRTLDVEYGIYFTSESNFLIFSLVLRIRENKKQKSCLTHEINSILNIKSSEFSVYYISIFNFKPFNILYIYQKKTYERKKNRRNVI